MARVCIEGQEQWTRSNHGRQRITLPQAEHDSLPHTSDATGPIYVPPHPRALRAYQERGIVEGGLARREPEDIPVVFQTDTERVLYHRIDDLCSHFYRLADLPPAERGGVGFLMAVFRKRLASCFVAFQRSLERRRDLVAAIQQGLSDVDVGYELDRDVSEDDEDEDDETDILSSTGSAAISCGYTRTRGDERRWKLNGSTCKTTSQRLTR